MEVFASSFLRRKGDSLLEKLQSVTTTVDFVATAAVTVTTADAVTAIATVNVTITAAAVFDFVIFSKVSLKIPCLIGEESCYFR